MVTTYYPFSSQQFYLGSSCGSADTTILLSSFVEPVSGTPYTMAYLNTSIVYGTIAPQTTSSELISFTGITQNINGTALLTGVTRGLQKAWPFTASATFQLPHAGQTIFIISDAPQVFQEYANLNSPSTINALWNFTVTPTGLNPGAVPDASTTVLGITKLSVAPVSSTNPIAVGQNDPLVSPVSLTTLTAGQIAALPGNDTTIATGAGNLFVTQTGLQNGTEKYATSTGSANAYVLTLSPVPTAYKAGQQFSFLANFGCTGASTLNVNSLGAIAIKKLNGTTELASGDIASGQIVTVEYDGTNFQMTSPVNEPIPYTTGFGAWAQPVTIGTPWQATTDGFFVAVVGANGISTAVTCSIKTDSSSTPTTVRAEWYSSGTTNENNIATLFSPVRKGDYILLTYQGVSGVSGYWLPLS